MPARGLFPSFWNGIRLAFADLFHRDQRHCGEHFGVLRLLPEFLEGAHYGDRKPGLDRRILQVFCAPLQNGVPHGFGARNGPEEVKRTGRQPRVNVYSYCVPPIPRFVK